MNFYRATAACCMANRMKMTKLIKYFRCLKFFWIYHSLINILALHALAWAAFRF